MNLHMTRLPLLFAGALLAASAAQADDARYAPASALWQSECGSCHLAYPAELLPAAGWRALFASLDQHFGSDASLDAATTTALLKEAEARAARRGSGAPTRITETPWFRHEHDEIAAAIWKRAAIGTPANCAACHRGAERGDFAEAQLRIPR